MGRVKQSDYDTLWEMQIEPALEFDEAGMITYRDPKTCRLCGEHVWDPTADLCEYHEGVSIVQEALG